MPYVAGQSNFPQFPDGVINYQYSRLCYQGSNYTLLVRWLGSRQTTFLESCFRNCMELDAYRLFDQETNLQAYGEFMSAEYAWDYVVFTPLTSI